MLLNFPILNGFKRGTELAASKFMQPVWLLQWDSEGRVGAAVIFCQAKVTLSVVAFI